MKKRKTYSSEFKLKVAIDALREQETIAQLASKYELSTTQINTWKKKMVACGGLIFERETKAKKATDSKLTDSLYQRIGELEMQLGWLKKKGLLK